MEAGCGSASSTSTSCPGPGDRMPSTGCCPTRSSRSSWPTGSASTTSGRSSTTSSRSTRTPRRPRCSSPRPASGPSGSGWVTASCRCRPRSTTRPGSPSGSPPWTSSPTGGSSSAPGSRAPRPSWAASAWPREAKRAMWEETLDAVTRMFAEEPFAGYDGQFLHDAAAQRGAQAAAEAAPAAVGGLQPAGDHPPGRAQRHRRAVVLLRRAGGGRALGRRVLRPDRLGGVRAARLRGQPERGRGAADDAAPGRGDRDRPRHRRRALLRLLARPLLRRRPAHRSATPTCGGASARTGPSTGSRGRSSRRAPRRWPSGCCRRGSARCAARSAPRRRSPT